MFRKLIPSKIYNWQRNKKKNDDEGENIRLKIREVRRKRRFARMKRYWHKWFQFIFRNRRRCSSTSPILSYENL